MDDKRKAEVRDYFIINSDAIESEIETAIDEHDEHLKTEDDLVWAYIFNGDTESVNDRFKSLEMIFDIEFTDDEKTWRNLDFVLEDINDIMDEYVTVPNGYWAGFSQNGYMGIAVGRYEWEV